MNHFSGNITAEPSPNTVVAFNGIINIDLYFCENEFIFNGTACNNDHCQNYFTNGTYQGAKFNSTVTILGVFYELLNY